MQLEQIRVTPKQNEYLIQLNDGPKTTKELMQHFMVSMSAASKILNKIRDAGMIESPHVPGAQGNVRIHTLTTNYDKLVDNGMIVTNYNRSIPLLEEEIFYAAILRNGFMTGQRLKTQYHKLYPNRTSNAIDNVVTKARYMGLCR